jgi:glutathione S-transferase
MNLIHQESSMLTLCGMPTSTFYNKVKLALLEKEIPFAEEYVPIYSTDAAVLSASPLGKIPFIRTEQGGLCESQAILEYLETAYPQKALIPADAFAAAKVRELTTFIDWHLDSVARETYGQAFFGGKLDEARLLPIRELLVKNIAGFKRLASFSPFVAGDVFSQADCSAFVTLSTVGMATKAVFGEDLLLSGGVDYKAYLRLIGARESATKVMADRRTSMTKA